MVIVRFKGNPRWVITVSTLKYCCSCLFLIWTNVVCRSCQPLISVRREAMVNRCVACSSLIKFNWKATGLVLRTKGNDESTLSLACSISVRAVRSSYWMVRTFSFDALQRDSLWWHVTVSSNILTEANHLSRWSIGSSSSSIDRLSLGDDALDREDFRSDARRPVIEPSMTSRSSRFPRSAMRLSLPIATMTNERLTNEGSLVLGSAMSSRQTISFKFVTRVRCDLPVFVTNPTHSWFLWVSPVAVDGLFSVHRIAFDWDLRRRDCSEHAFLERVYRVSDWHVEVQQRCCTQKKQRLSRNSWEVKEIYRNVNGTCWFGSWSGEASRSDGRWPVRSASTSARRTWIYTTNNHSGTVNNPWVINEPSSPAIYYRWSRIDFHVECNDSSRYFHQTFDVVPIIPDRKTINTKRSPWNRLTFLASFNSLVNLAITSNEAS